MRLLPMFQSLRHGNAGTQYSAKLQRVQREIRLGAPESASSSAQHLALTRTALLGSSVTRWVTCSMLSSHAAHGQRDPDFLAATQKFHGLVRQLGAAEAWAPSLALPPQGSRSAPLGLSQPSCPGKASERPQRPRRRQELCLKPGCRGSGTGWAQLPRCPVSKATFISGPILLGS